MPQTSSGQHLLQPNRAPSTRAKQTILVEVSSHDRNYNNQIATNPLRFLFARPLKDVQAIELLAGTVPANPFNINANNNRFTFQEGNAQYTIAIPPASYTTAQLCLALETQLNAIGGLNVYSVAITSTGFTYITLVAGSTPYAFLFASGSPTDPIDREDGFLVAQNTPASLLGFDINDYYSDGSFEVKSPYRANAAINRLYLYLNFDNNLSFSSIERGSGRRSPFAIIYLDEQTNGYKFLNKDTLTPASYVLPQPYARVQNMNVEFRDEFYRLVDFGGEEFSLLFQITTLE